VIPPLDCLHVGDDFRQLGVGQSARFEHGKTGTGHNAAAVESSGWGRRESRLKPGGASRQINIFPEAQPSGQIGAMPGAE
jgi:hypothetical protein